MSEHEVIDPQGQPIQPNPGTTGGPSAPDNPSLLVQQPAKVMRIGTMIKQLLEEVKSAPLDEAARARLSGIYSQSISELKDGLAPELVEELERLSLPLTDQNTPSEGELRIAKAQLVGWLEGLFHGIQAAVFAQQAAAQAQLQQMRGQPQLTPPASGPGEAAHAPDDGSGATGAGSVGQYL